MVIVCLQNVNGRSHMNFIYLHFMAYRVDIETKKQQLTIILCESIEAIKSTTTRITERYVPS